MAQHLSTQLANLQVPPPKDWQEFQRLCRAAFGEQWGDPNCVQYGADGQKQYGIDILGQLGGIGEYVGAQCKLISHDRGRSRLSIGEVSAWVDEGDICLHPLKFLVLATTAKRDEKITSALVSRNATRQNAGKWPAKILFWEDLLEIAELFPKLHRLFLPAGIKMDHQELDAVGVESRGIATKVVGALTSGAPAFGVSSVSFLSAVEPLADAGLVEAHQFLDEGNHIAAIAKAQSVRNAAIQMNSTALQARALSVVAATHCDAGRDADAVIVLRAAADIDSGGEVGLACSINAEMILGNHDEANARAESATALYPGSARLWARRMFAALDTERCTLIEEQIPDALKAAPAVLASRIACYAHQKAFTKARVLAQEAIDLEPNAVRNKLFFSEALAAEVFESSKESHLGELSLENARLVHDATIMLRPLWERLRKGAYFRRGATFALNLSAFYSACAEHQDAVQVSRDAANWAPDDYQIQRQLAITLSKAGDNKKAIAQFVALGGKLSGSDVLTLADMLLSTSEPARALQLLDQRDDSIQADEFRSHLLLIRARAVFALGDAEQLLKAIEALEAVDETMACIVRANSAARQGDEGGRKSMLVRAAELVALDNDSFRLALVADQLSQARMYEESIPLLQRVVRGGSDSELLRDLLVAYLASDRIFEAIQLVRSLSPNILNAEFYVEVRAAIDERVGKIEGAESLLREFLVTNPGAVRPWLRLCRLLLRTSEDAARKEIAKYKSKHPLGRKERHSIIQLLSTVGLIDDAIEQAYQLAKQFPDDPDSHAQLVMLVLVSDRSMGPILSPQLVTDDVAVTLEVSGEAGGAPFKRVLLIERDAKSDSRNDVTYVRPSDDRALRLRNKKVGDIVEAAKSSLASGVGTWRITAIQSKYVHQMHLSLARHKEVFAARGIIQSIAAPQLRDDGSLDAREIVQALSERRRQTQEVESLYRKDGLPAWFAFRYLGDNEIDVWRQWTSQRDSTFRVCVGTAEERDAATSVLAGAPIEGVVIDPMDLILLVELKCFTGFKKCFGRIGIPRSCIELVEHARIAANSRVNDSDGILTLDKADTPALIRFAPGAADEWLALLTQVIDIAKRECETLSAIPVAPTTPEWAIVVGALKQPALDLAYASENSNFPLVTSDSGLRGIFNQARSIRSTWLQASLLVAHRKGCLSILDYARCVARLATRGYAWTSVDARSVMALLYDSDFFPTRDLRELLRLGTNLRKAEKATAIAIARDCVDEIWDRATSEPNKVASTLVVINGLTEDGNFRGIEVADAFARRVDRPSLYEGLNNWGRMHFLWNDRRYTPLA